MVDLGGLIPKERVAVSISTFWTIFLPALISYLTMGVLVQRKRTRTMRFVLLPIALLCAHRAGSVPDFSFGIPSYRYFNQSIVLCMHVVSMRMTVWAFTKKSYKRISPKYDTKNQTTDEDDTPLSIAFWNAWDLSANFRGIGWDWSEGLRVPKSSYETQSTSRFLLGTLVKLLFYALAFDATSGAVRDFSPETFRSIEGGGIFDPSLPPLSRYTQSTIITFVSGWTAYFVTNLMYQVYTIVFVLLFRQGPSQWPPLFDAPWFSTSLVNLWGYRWHQLYRECFIAVAKPFSYLFGRPGGVIGAFATSGALHYIGLESTERGGYPIAVFGFFVMHGVGILLEGMWKRCTGVRVGGFFGLVWTWFWVLLWANFMVDAWARVNSAGSFFPDGYRPTVLLAEILRGCLDRLLHS